MKKKLRLVADAWKKNVYVRFFLFQAEHDTYNLPTPQILNRFPRLYAVVLHWEGKDSDVNIQKYSVDLTNNRLSDQISKWFVNFFFNWNEHWRTWQQSSPHIHPLASVQAADSTIHRNIHQVHELKCKVMQRHFDRKVFVLD